MIKIIQFGDGRTWESENETDRRLILAFMDSVAQYDRKRTRKNKKHLKQQWIKVEANIGRELERSTGIPREEIFNNK